MTFTQSLVSRIRPFQFVLAVTTSSVATTLVTSISGFVFWWIAAQRFDQSAVGVAGAAIAIMIVLSQVAELGTGTKLAGLIHNQPDRGRLGASALAVSAMAGAVLGLLFAVVAQLILPEFAEFAEGPASLLLFAAGVSLSAMATVLDQLQAATARNGDRLLRNAAFAVLRLPILTIVAAASATGIMIYGAWVIALATSLVGLAVLRRSAMAWPSGLATLRGMAGDSLAHHIVNLCRSSSLWLLPVIVTVVVSREANASFYVALLMANFLALVGSSSGFSLYIIGSRAHDSLLQQVRFSLVLGGSFSLLGIACLAGFGGQLLHLFGNSYVAAFPALMLLAVASLPLLVREHWVALARINGNMGLAARVGAGSLLLEILAAIVGGYFGGVEGLAVARLFVLSLEAILMAPTVFSAVSNPAPRRISLTTDTGGEL